MYSFNIPDCKQMFHYSFPQIRTWFQWNILQAV